MVFVWFWESYEHCTTSYGLSTILVGISRTLQNERARRTLGDRLVAQKTKYVLRMGIRHISYDSHTLCVWCRLEIFWLREIHFFEIARICQVSRGLYVNCRDCYRRVRMQHIRAVYNSVRTLYDSPENKRHGIWFCISGIPICVEATLANVFRPDACSARWSNACRTIPYTVCIMPWVW